jgi:hypothetical protein
VKGLHGTSWRCCEARSPLGRGGATGPAEYALLAPFSLGVPVGLLERLRAAARQLGLCEGEIAAEAIERLLDEEGF